MDAEVKGAVRYEYTSIATKRARKSSDDEFDVNEYAASVRVLALK